MPAVGIADGQSRHVACSIGDGTVLRAVLAVAKAYLHRTFHRNLEFTVHPTVLGIVEASGVDSERCRGIVEGRSTVGTVGRYFHSELVDRCAEHVGIGQLDLEVGESRGVLRQSQHGQDDTGKKTEVLVFHLVFVSLFCKFVVILSLRWSLWDYKDTKFLRMRAPQGAKKLLKFT